MHTASFFGRRAALLLLAAAPAWGAPKLTTIQDVLYKADGTRLSGSVVIAWTSFDAGDTSVIGMQTLTVPLVNGAIFVRLVPTTTATPAAAYTVSYQSEGKIQFQEQWAVPPASAPLRVRNVRTAVLTVNTPTGTAAAATPIPESSVTGLVADLNIRPTKGVGYGTGRAALVNDTGGIETVVGNLQDCVRVDGTSGQCFDATLLPTYMDGETPGGVVDGANAAFTLAAAPLPAASLELFRNGVALSQGSDYTLSASTITFAAGVAPQPLDKLVAWYRAAAAGAVLAGKAAALSTAPSFAPAMAQVLCSANGAGTASTTPVSVGRCSIPAGLLLAGDRVEIRVTATHVGGAAAFQLQLNWGSTALVARAGLASDSIFTVRGDAALTGTSALWIGQSYGQNAATVASIAVAQQAPGAAAQIDFLANLLAAGTNDSFSLANYTVLRFPAISHP